MNKVSFKTNEDIRSKCVKTIDLSIKSRALVEPFTEDNMSLEDMFLRFDSREELDEFMSKTSEWFHINLE